MLLLLCIFLPVVGGLALFLLRPASAKARNPLVMGVALLTSACVTAALLQPGGQQVTLLRLTDYLTISFKLDGLGRVFAGLLAFLWPLSTLYATEYMRHEGGENSFFAFYILSYGLTLGIAMAEDLMTLYIFYELMTFSTLPLVMHGMKPRNAFAGRKYVYYSMGGAALAFMAMAAVIFYGGSSDFVYGGTPGMSAASPQMLTALFFLGFLGFGVKAAVFPLHGWLPTAGVAPTPVTALLHAVAVVKAGVFAVMRLTYYSFGADMLRGSWAQTAALGLALASILFGSVMAVKEQNLKRRLAYSTMSNLSYVLFGALLMTPEGLTAGLMHMVFHALMKITLFSCVGAVLVQTGLTQVSDLRGIRRRMPFTMAIFAFSAIALVGIPPFVGFQSKWALATAGMHSGHLLGLVGMGVLIASAVLTAVYLLVPVVSAYVQPLPSPEAWDGKTRDPGPCMRIPLLITSAVMLALVFASAPLIDFLSRVAQGLL